MSGKLSALRKRLAKVEQKMADQAQRWELANCKCQVEIIILDPEHFETELAPCPVHGFRRLGEISMFRSANPPRMDELMAIYQERLAQADREKGHDRDES
jgi:hypothetical protein